MIKINPRKLVRASLTVARFAGPVVTGILAFNSGMKAKDAVEADQYQIETTNGDDKVVSYVGFEDLDRKEKIRVMTPIILPPIVACAATITASAIDKRMDVKYIKEINGLYTVALGSAMAYRDKLKEINPEAAIDVEEELAEREYPRESDAWNLEVPEHSSAVDGEQMFIMTMTGRRFYSNVDFVKNALSRAENDYNTEVNFGDLNVCLHCKSMAVNDLYGYLGLELTDFGYEFGWYGQPDRDTDDWEYSGKEIHFELRKGKNGVYYITPNVAPFEGWYEL